MSVHYKFKSTLDFDTVSFDGLHISVADLKKAIFHQKRIGKNTDFDLQITNAQTKEDYIDDSTLIAKNTSLIIARVPLTIQQKRSWDRSETQAFNNSKDESNLGRSVDLTRLDGSEEDKIRAMITQSTQDYDPSNYLKIRGSNQTGEVPPNYRCYKCHQPGHWIKNCPLGINQESIEIKKSTGIPRSFMVPVEGPSVPGAMMTPGGTYAVPAIDHQAYKEGKKEKPPFAQDPEPVFEKPEIPEDLVCNICKDLLTDAVMIPCCGNSFCDECIRTFLLESEDHECPDCNEKDVSPESLIPNRYLRNAVLNFKNETGYAKRPAYKLHQQTPTLSQKIALSNSGQDSPIQEKLTVLTIVNPAAQMEIVDSTTAVTMRLSSSPNTDADDKEVDNSSSKATPIPYTQETLSSTDLIESLPEPNIRSDIVTKLIDDETEVPLPPGTEPPLLPKRLAEHACDDKDFNTDFREKEYPKDKERYSRERRRSFSRDNHRDRNASYHSRLETIRPASRRRSLSPRNCHPVEYSTHQVSVHGKIYQGRVSSDNRYHASSMHYDPNLRRSIEDRAGTPTVDEPHLHGQSHSQTALLPYPPGEEHVPPTNYSSGPVVQPSPSSHNPPLLPDPYMAPPRLPIYPSHQQLSSNHGYGHPQPSLPPRYDNRSSYQQSNYRPSQLSRNYSGVASRPIRGMHNISYRGIQPPPPGMGRNIHNGSGVIDDPLEAFQRMLREKDERDRRMGKHRSMRTRSRSRSRSYSRSRSRSFSRRGSSPSRPSRSHSPATKRRDSRSPLSSHRTRSRSPKKRRSRSGSFSISRSRSYSRSQSPRGSLPRERNRDRKGKHLRDLSGSYRSITRSPPRYHKERDRERERNSAREPYGSYYNDTAAPAPAVSQDYHSTTNYHEHRSERQSRYTSRVQSLSNSRQSTGSALSDTLLPSASGLIVPPVVAPPGNQVPPPSQQQQLQAKISVSPAILPSIPTHHPPSLDRKDYYDSCNRYPGAPSQLAPRFNKRFDDVAPPGTEGYYDLQLQGIAHIERPSLTKDHAKSKDKSIERSKEERRRSDDKIRNRNDRDKHDRDYNYEKDTHRYDRHSLDRKQCKRSSSPYSMKYRIDTKDVSPERLRKKDKDHDDKSEERKKEKKIKEKKKRKDNDEKEKKKKKKKDKKALIQKEATAAVAVETVTTSVDNNTILPIIKIKEEPQSADENSLTEPCNKSSTPVNCSVDIIVKTEPSDDPHLGKNVEEKTCAKRCSINPEPPELRSSITKTELSKNETSQIDIGVKLEACKIPEKLLTKLINDIETSTTSVPTKTENESRATTVTIVSSKCISPNKEDCLATMPELSKWERDENAEKLDEFVEKAKKELSEMEDTKHNKIVTTEVLKRAENAIFQKAINAIRPIEIKKISESRKVLYQNPEPKVLDPQNERDSRKCVNVTINVGKNERNVEISSEPLKKSKLERPKIKCTLSPTRLSVKERLGDKIEDENKVATIKCMVDQRRDSNKSNPTSDIAPRNHSPRIVNRERRVSLPLETRPDISNSDRKVFVDDRKRERIDKSRIDVRQIEGSIRNHERTDFRKSDRQTRTPPPIITYKLRKEEETDSNDRKKENCLRRSRDEKKRKKEYHSRSKSRERKKRKDKKHKKDRDRSNTSNVNERSMKYNKDREVSSTKEKVVTGDKQGTEPILVEHWKKQRGNPRLVSDRKRIILDEANFEPDYSASDTESEDNDRSTLLATKRAKVENSNLNIESEVKSKKRNKQASSSEDEESSTTESSSTESDSSVETHKKKKKEA